MQSAAYADSHVHLHWYDDVDGLLSRAAEVGVVLVVGVGVDLESSRRTIELARSHPMVSAGVGFHPLFFDEGIGTDDLAQLARLARDPTVGFIGEIGIDTVEATVSLDRQLGVLRDELALARETGRAVNLHLRGAVEIALQTIAATGVPPAGAVFHYFVGDEELARRALDLGLFLSIGKPITRVDNLALRQAVVGVPLDRLLLETDSYPLSGRSTEPTDVVQVARTIAELHECSPEQVGASTTANLRRLISGTT